MYILGFCFFRLGDLCTSAELWKRINLNTFAGVLYYGDSAANGVKASTFVEELTSRADYERFISAQPDNILTVIQVSRESQIES